MMREERRYAPPDGHARYACSPTAAAAPPALNAVATRAAGRKAEGEQQQARAVRGKAQRDAAADGSRRAQSR